MNNPVYISKYNIYDIYHNDNNNIIIISPSENNQLIIKYNNETFSINVCPENHTYIYVLKRQIEYKKHITLNISGENIYTEVNKYPEFKNEIIMTTEVKDEDAYIRQWIIFHYNIGISRFIIYDNSDNNVLSTLLSDFIKNKIVLLINWKYPLFLENSGISGQSTQQNHSIWAFKNSKYIGLFDIDEYVNIKNETNIHRFFNNLIHDEKINTKNIGSFRLLNKFFYNPHNLPTNDFEFLKIYNCDEIILHEREKNFVIPKNVYTFCVHKITFGKEMYTVSYNKLYFNHYCFLNKQTRCKDNTNLIDDSMSSKIFSKNILPVINKLKINNNNLIIRVI